MEQLDQLAQLVDRGYAHPMNAITAGQGWFADTFEGIINYRLVLNLAFKA